MQTQVVYSRPGTTILLLLSTVSMVSLLLLLQSVKILSSQVHSQRKTFAWLILGPCTYYLVETDLKKTLQLGQQAYLEPGFEATWNMGV